MTSTPRPTSIFVSGGTGYLGQTLLPALLARGHVVRAVARRGGERRLPAGCEVVVGNALAAATFEDRVGPADTYVHLVGVSHPSPWKADEFRRVDLGSTIASLTAAQRAGIRHFVYLSVAQPAPIMREYLAVRAECERRIADSGIAATFVRPWYVLGPGHRWPYLLIPFYALLRAVPATREGALRLGLVRRREMTAALVWAVEHPPTGVRTMPVEAIRDPERWEVAGASLLAV